MALLKLTGGVGADAAEVKAVEGFANYTGPTPPAGLYRARVTSMKVVESKGTGGKAKKPMFQTALTFEAVKGDEREKYNGYLLMHRLIIPDDKSYQWYELQVGQINRLIDAMAGDNWKAARIAMWSGKVVISDDKKVMKFGSALNMKKQGGVYIMVDTRSRTFPRPVMVDGKPKRDPKTKKAITESVLTLEVNDLFPIKDEDSKPTKAAEPEEEIYSDDEGPEDPNAEVYDEDEADEEVADDDPEEEEVEEPEPEEEEDPEDEEPEEEVEEEPEEEPEPEPEPAPAKKATKRAPKRAPAKEPEEDIDAIAAEVPEEEEAEEAPDPAPRKRTRRSF